MQILQCTIAGRIIGAGGDFSIERGEAEKNAEDFIDRYGLFGKDAKSLDIIDAKRKTRVYDAPALVH